MKRHIDKMIGRMKKDPTSPIRTEILKTKLEMRRIKREKMEVYEVKAITNPEWLERPAYISYVNEVKRLQAYKDGLQFLLNHLAIKEIQS